MKLFSISDLLWNKFSIFSFSTSIFQGCNVMAGCSLLPLFGKLKYLKSQHSPFFHSNQFDLAQESKILTVGGGLIGYVKSKPLGNGQIISIDVLVVVMIIAVFHKKLIWPPVRALSKLKRHLLDLTLWTTVLRATTTIDRWRHICFHLRFLSFESGFDIAIEKCCCKERLCCWEKSSEIQKD